MALIALSGDGSWIADADFAIADEDSWFASEDLAIADEDSWFANEGFSIADADFGIADASFLDRQRGRTSSWRARQRSAVSRIGSRAR